MGIALLPKLVVGLVVGLGAGVGLAAVLVLSGSLGPREAAATGDGSGNVHACVSIFTGATRIKLPGQPPTCNAGEYLVELGGAEAVATLQGQLAALEADHAALAEQVPDCLSEVGGEAVFSGCNVQVNNGLGATSSTNGKGNLIVGYNENELSFNRDGSHNIVGGKNAGYSSYGGLVVGHSNRTTGIFASVSGGSSNTASGSFSSVSGGGGNTASNQTSSISGGQLNTASGLNSSVSGGDGNEASGNASSISGGRANAASGNASSVVGGINNEASGEDASISGGFLNVASGFTASVSGGQGNNADGPWSSISGGLDHVISVEGFANTDHDWIAGTLAEDF